MAVAERLNGNKASAASGQRPEVKILRQRCAGCQECVVRCPTGALSMDRSIWVATVSDEGLCVGCRQCERTCPFSAIHVYGPALVAERTRADTHAGPVATGDVSEVRKGLTRAEAMAEARRCLNCPDPTCVRGCPAHNDIPAFIEAIREDNLDRAQSILAQTSCMPDVCSRVCDSARQCEGSCSWSLAGGQPVSISRLERYVADNSRVPGVRQQSERGKGLSVGIVGSGVAAQAAAWELASAGASVTIYERDREPGGVVRWGIPAYVLPDAVRERVMKALAGADVELRLNSKVAPNDVKLLLHKHDAVIAAYGAPVPGKPRIPGVDLEGVVDSAAFLKKAKQALANGLLPDEMRGACILVLGGGNTGIDVARSAVRLGAKAIIVHPEEERFSLARPDEIAEARSEGVEFRIAHSVARFEGERGKLRRAVLVPTRQKSAGAFPESVPGGETTSVDISTAVLATGFRLDPELSGLFEGLPLKPPKAEAQFPDRRWVGSGIFSAKSEIGRKAWEGEYCLRYSALPKGDRLWLVGDALVGPATVVRAMAQGRQAARGILEARPRRPASDKPPAKAQAD